MDHGATRVMPAERADCCTVCGSTDLMACYGMAFGGLGPYVVCESCDEVVCKQLNEPGTCLQSLEPSDG